MGRALTAEVHGVGPDQRLPAPLSAKVLQGPEHNWVSPMPLPGISCPLASLSCVRSLGVVVRWTWLPRGR